MQNISTTDALSTSGNLLAYVHSPMMSCEKNNFQSLQCDVVFGSPKDDCRGTGICRITTSFDRPFLSQLKKDCRQAAAILLADPMGKTISLLFRHSALCSHLTRHYFFEKHFFETQQPSILSAAAASVLKLKTAIIPAGKHRIEQGKGFYRIDFQLV